jgi:hypothetical protein
VRARSSRGLGWSSKPSPAATTAVDHSALSCDARRVARKNPNVAALASNVDEGIQRWWAAVKAGPESYFTQRWDAQLLALGPSALERTLDCIDGKAKLDITRQDCMEHRDLGDWEEVAVVAHARADVGHVLSCQGRRRAPGERGRRVGGPTALERRR